MVVIRRHWVLRVPFQKHHVLHLGYSSNFRFVALQLRLQAVNYRVFIPIAIRMQLNSDNTLRLHAYNKKALKLMVTWTKVLKHMLWGSAFPYLMLLEARGLGYKLTAKSPTTLEFNLGYSHLVYYMLPASMKAATLGLKSKVVSISCPDWLLLTQTVTRIKRLKRVNLYKERGIFYRREVCHGLKDVKRKKN